MSTSTRRSHLALSCFGLALALGASACNLYFGPDHNSQGTYSYCDQNGCYTCTGNTCTPQGGPGYGCSSSNQCAAGCYCDLSKGANSGTCVETGFCTADAQCQSGYHCDARGTCVPDNSPGGCTSSNDCASGQYCDTFSGTCQASTTCAADGSCPTGYACDSRGTCVPVGCTDSTMCASGCYCDTTSGDPNFGQCVETGYCTADNQCPTGYYCDETRSTCMPGTDPNQPSCGGTVTCSTAQPTCPADQVPLIQNGCWTGQCEAISACDVPPACSEINTEASCTGRTDCAPIYNGINCTKPDGTACKSGDTNCTCQKYVFASCTAKGV